MSTILHTINTHSAEFKTLEDFRNLKSANKHPVLSLYQDKLYVYSYDQSGIIAKVCDLFRRMYNAFFFRFDFDGDKIHDRVKFLKSHIKELTKVRSENAALETSNTKLKEEKKTLSIEVEKLKSETSVLEEKQNNIATDLERIQLELASKTDDLAHASAVLKRYDEIKNEVPGLEEKRESLLLEKTKLEEEIHVLESNKEITTAEYKKDQEALASKIKESLNAQSILDRHDQIKREMPQLEKEHAELSAKLEELRGQIEPYTKLMAENKKLKEEVESAKRYGRVKVTSEDLLQQLKRAMEEIAPTSPAGVEILKQIAGKLGEAEAN